VANYRVNTNINNSSGKTIQDKANKKKTKRTLSIKLFIVKREFLKVPAFGAETHLAEGQWQEE
jgi:hypothetical protein